VAETWVWLRLRERAGAPDPAFPPWLAPSGSRPTTVAPVSEACRAATAPMNAELESLRLRAEKEFDAEVLFDKETSPNQALSAKLQPIVDRIHKAASPADRAIPLTVTCRGLVCKLDPPAGVAVDSDSMKAVVLDPEMKGQVRRVSFESKNGRSAGPLFFSVIRPPSESRSGGDMLRHFVNDAIGKDDVLGTCRKRVSEGAASTAAPAGKLSIQLLCPGEGETNQDGVPRRLSFRLGDSLADTAFGRCVAEQLTTRAAAFPLPPDLTRAEVEKTFEIP